MHILLGGKFESALIRALDALNRPRFNEIGHPYYMGLNRNIDRSFFDRLGTFLSIASDSSIIGGDWNPDGDGPVRSGSLGILYGENQLRSVNEWDNDTTHFVDALLATDILSRESIEYASETDYSRTEDHRREEARAYVIRHYICRLIAQIRNCQGRDYMLVLDEGDIRIISEIRSFLLDAKPDIDFQLPDIDEKVVFGQDFAAGLLNFTPRSLSSIKSIREDLVIRDYASQVRYHLQKAKNALDSQRILIQEMRKALKLAKSESKAKKVFEVMSWVAKPLHYVPIAGQVLTLAEDTKDVVTAALGRDASSRSWYLLAARAQEIDIDVYLARKSNIG